MSHRAHGEGSIAHRKDGRWQASLQIDGRRVYVYGETRAEVVEKLRGLTEQARKTGGRLPTAGKMTVQAFLTDWLDQAKPRLRPKTVENYERTIRLHIVPSLGGLPLAKLTALRLGRHYSELSKTTGARTIQVAHRILHKALHDAERWGLIAANPAARVDCPTAEPKEAGVWTPEQIRLFVSALSRGEGGQYGNLLLFLLASGCREGEALGLTWTDIDWDRATVRIERQVTFAHHRPVELPPKTEAGRRCLTLPSWGLEALRRQQPASCQRVFVTATCTTPNPANVLRSLHGICRRLDLPALRVHDLRRLNLSLLAMAGVPVRVAQQRAGHSRASVTQEIYQRVLGDADRQAADAIDKALGRG